MVGSFPNRPRNANDVSSVFSRFLLDFGLLFCVAGAVFGWLLLVCALYMTFHRWAGPIMRGIFPGRRKIWWGWRVSAVAPRIVHDVSYVSKTWGTFFLAGALYLVRLEGECCCSTHCNWRFKCEQDQSWESFFVAGAPFGDVGVSLFVAGAAFGEVGASLFVAGAAFGEIWVDSRSAAKCWFFNAKHLRSTKGNLGQRACARWRVHGRIIPE